MLKVALNTFILTLHSLCILHERFDLFEIFIETYFLVYCVYSITSVFYIVFLFFALLLQTYHKLFTMKYNTKYILVVDLKIEHSMLYYTGSILHIKSYDLHE